MTGTTYGLTSTEGTQEMIKQIEKFEKITADMMFLDIGSGEGSVVYDFQKLNDLLV